MSDFLSVAKWAIEHGAAGVLALAVIAQTIVIRRLWGDLKAAQDARIEDMVAYTSRAEALYDKTYKLVGDVEKAIEFIKERRTR